MTAPSGAPLVSVVMGTYNCAHTIDEALDSIAAQTYGDWELVVCDDASTDATRAHLDAFAECHPGRVTVLQNHENRKLAHSLNRCLEHARGEYVARMDGDDISLPERLAVLVDHLEGHPEVDLVGSAMRRFDSAGPRDVVRQPADPGRFSLKHGVPFFHATVCARRAVFDTLGGYTVSRRTERGQDLDLWFRFFDAGLVGHNLPDPLYLVREDQGAIERRTMRVRWRSFQTSVLGFRRLGYPTLWYAVPVLQLAKGLVPVRGFMAYRRWQASRQRSAASSGGGRPHR